MNYVISSHDNLRGYLVHALNIDITFINLFNVHDLMSALEHTLHYRPKEVPTEIYLKSQNLWIMHKLLIRVGLSEQFLLLINTLIKQKKNATDDVRNALKVTLKSCFDRVSNEAIPVSQIVEEVQGVMVDYRKTYGAFLEEERKFHTAQRCDVIRWFAWVMCHNGLDWLKVAHIDQLMQGYAYWKQDVVNRVHSPLKPDAKPFQPSK